MIKASELKQKRLSNLDATMNNIEADILRSEARGQRAITYHFKPNDPCDAIISAITSHGYIVKKYEGYDQRDGDWKYITISWD